MDKQLVPSASTDETKVSYYKMKGDYYRYLAEFATGDEKGKVAEGVCDACVEATQIAEKDLVVTLPIRLAMALNSSVFQSEVLQNLDDCDPDFAGDVHVGQNDLDVPVVVQRQISMVQTVQKTKEIPQLQCIDKVVDDPVVQIPQMQVVDKTVEDPQVHPTDVVKPDDPDAKLKFLVKEVLHGVVWFVFDAHGNRVANELGGRNCVSGEMWKNEPPFNLALNKATSDDIAWQRKKYTGRGVRKLHESGTTLAEGIEALVWKMPDSIEAHCQSAKDPDGGPYSAFASDKSWSEASGEIGSEKKSYHNVSSGADFAAQPFCVAEYVEPTPEVTYGHVDHPVTTRTVVAHTEVFLIQRVQKMEEVPQVQFIDKVIDIPVISERQMSMMNQMQKTVEVSRVQLFIDRVVDDPDCAKKRRKAEGQDQDVDVDRFKDLVLPSSSSCLCVSIASSDEGGDEAGDGSTEGCTEVKKTGRTKPTKKSTASSGGEEEELKQQAEARSLVQGGERRSEGDETHAQGPGSELVQVAPNMGAGGSHPQATMDQEWAEELREIRRMIEFLVHRERKLDVKTDVATRRLERLERESFQLEDEEREASLEEAFADHTKVVKLTVDKWFVDKGVGFGTAPSGEVVFIHANAVQGAEVLVVGTEAWTGRS